MLTTRADLQEISCCWSNARCRRHLFPADNRSIPSTFSPSVSRQDARWPMRRDTYVRSASQYRADTKRFLRVSRHAASAASCTVKCARMRGHIMQLRAFPSGALCKLERLIQLERAMRLAPFVLDKLHTICVNVSLDRTIVAWHPEFRSSSRNRLPIPKKTWTRRFG